MYPFPIPDLFCGNPLVVSGRFHGSFPESITLSGLLPDQSTWQTEVPSKRTLTVPLSKVVINSIQVVREDSLMTKMKCNSSLQRV